MISILVNFFLDQQVVQKLSLKKGKIIILLENQISHTLKILKIKSIKNELKLMKNNY